MNLASKIDIARSSSPRSWKWIGGVSFLVCGVSLLGGFFVVLTPLELLGALFGVGVVAGALSTRQAWLSGIIVGFPLGVEQLTLYALREFGSLSVVLAQPDYWHLVAPISFVTTGVAILGGLTGAWLLGKQFSPR
ncbi:MAG: hypothetical protein JNK54_04705 [Elusimicrobia bacterium]|jgi:hypothetical protein|nr:hypothetical protein [Elusimicrobiota bacterium]